MNSSAHPDTLFSRVNLRQLILVSVLLAAAVLHLRFVQSETGLKATANKIQAALDDAQGYMGMELLNLAEVPAEDLFLQFDQNRADYDKLGMSFFVFDKGELQAWSSGQIPQAEDIPDLYRSGPCVLFQSGWYLIKKLEQEHRQLYALFLVKSEYLYENRYLKNDFHSCIGLKDNPRIEFNSEAGAHPILTPSGETMFYVVEGEVNEAGRSGVLIILLIVLSIYFLVKVFFAWAFARNSSVTSFFMVAAVLIALRALNLALGYPFDIRGLSLFTAFGNASFSYPGLADLVINGFLFLMLCYALKEWLKRSDKPNSAIFPWLLLLGFFIVSRGLDNLFKHLIKDSGIAFDINNFFDLDLESIWGVIGVSIHLLGVLFFGQSVLRLFKQRFNQAKQRWWVGLISIGLLCIVFDHFMGVVDLVKVLWAWVLLLYLYLSSSVVNRGPRLAYILGLVILLSLYATHVFEKHVVNRDKEDLELLASRLTEGEDEVAEFLFEDIKLRMVQDSLLWNLMANKPFDSERLLRHYRQEYFNGYWSKYEIEFERRATEPLPSKIYQPIWDTLDLSVFRVAESDIGLNYVLRSNLDSTEMVLALFELDIIPEELGFPELLIEGHQTLGDRLGQYAIARYHRGELIDSYGSFQYRTSSLKAEQEERRYYKEKEFWHFPFQRGEDTYIISSPAEGFIDQLTTFTYLFSLMGLLLVMAYVVEYVILRQRIPLVDLQFRIQALIISLLFGSLLVFGIGAYYYILNQHRANNEKLLSEKVSSVLIELSHKLEKEQAFGDKEKLELYLDKFSKVFYTDINLYSLEGHLMASSRPQIFSRGFLSEQMHPSAFRELSLEDQSQYIHEEQIGDLTYLSAYVPFMDSRSKVLAYLNLPYFAKQAELENELSRFLVTAINVLLILFILSILIAVLVSNWITRPLQMLKENLAAMRLDKTNQPIDYQGSDEIASLVKEYNAKVEEIQRNAELLAKSERESAWREMAKQVAHEIKNPLTPMKLSIQYLQRTQVDQGPDWEERFKRSTNMLIEQIDTLSSIASAFSDFARMPKAEMEEFSLSRLIEQVVDLFSEDPCCSIEFKTELGEEAPLLADKDQISRLLTNLVKNAMQSIPEEQEGKVEVELMAKGHQYIIEVKDNGAGVPEDMQEKIFVPNFTTKTTGTGLGLAMCKNIVEQAGGKIWFQTSVGIGSSFFVSLPLPEDVKP